MPNLTLSIVEIIVLMLGAIVLGITIHFFLTSRRTLKDSLSPAKEKNSQNLNEWKLKYFNDVEIKDKELSTLRQQLQESEENREIFSIETEETRKENKRLQAELENLRKSTPTQNNAGDKRDYFEQLKQAQLSLLEHNEKINQLLGNV